MTQTDWLNQTYQSNDPQRIGEVENELDPRLKEYVRARFLSERNFERLRMWVLAGLPTGVHYGRGVEKAILQYLGIKISVVSLRKDMRCCAVKAIRYRGIAHERMEAIHEATMTALRPLFLKAVQNDDPFYPYLRGTHGDQTVTPLEKRSRSSENQVNR